MTSAAIITRIKSGLLPFASLWTAFGAYNEFHNWALKVFA
jgi:hypothetical protein